MLFVSLASSIVLAESTVSRNVLGAFDVKVLLNVSDRLAPAFMEGTDSDFKTVPVPTSFTFTVKALLMSTPSL
ncbi:hypothetical protein B8V81_3906 [Paenibacillus pasadenensis]|uniref:Uncharacterized protein n=1 Tax=Paenibacillus pasadenensis TaxID=217090 RepID=A0A2N5N557_9BACL|nr:hypothetical protein B8V81_3906 [Paenibacillus pasadenensis]